jgi:hypothetical protein
MIDWPVGISIESGDDSPQFKVSRRFYHAE